MPNDDRDLARIARVSPSRWPRVKARVIPLLMLNPDGRLSQKRLTKEWARVSSISEANRRNALSGWARRSSNNNGIDAAAASHSHQQNGCPHTQSQTKGKESSEAFERFWDLYPRKIGKDAARRAFAAAAKRAPAEDILRGAKRYAAARNGQDPKFTAHATTWLNAGRWADQEELRVNGPPPVTEMFGGLRIRELDEELHG